MKASHPFTVVHALPDVMLKVLFRTLTLGPYKIACNSIKTWSKWACELSDDEKALKRGMEPSVRSIMNDKRILLLQKIAGSLDWPDMEIFDSLINGFSIVGDQKPCGIFDLAPRPAGITIGELEGRFMLRRLMMTLRHYGKPPLRRLVTSLGCAGPCRLKIHDLYPSDWLPARRFGVWQSSGDKMKLRAIDDYSENRVNSAYSYMDRITLRTLDQSCLVLCRNRSHVSCQG